MRLPKPLLPLAALAAAALGTPVPAPVPAPVPDADALADAAPEALPDASSPHSYPNPSPNCNFPSLTPPAYLVLPTSSLPAPQSTWVLRHILLGVGTQNYTCASPASSVVPAANGALATLYNALPALASSPRAASSKIVSLPVSALQASTASSTFQMSRFIAANGLGVVGKHYFTSALTPTFALSAYSELFSGKKVANVSAPATAYAGPGGSGAVDWLYLENAGGSTGGLTAVYRVETAGGKAPATCNGQPGQVTVPYATEYWVYGTRV